MRRNRSPQNSFFSKVTALLGMVFQTQQREKESTLPPSVAGGGVYRDTGDYISRSRNVLSSPPPRQISSLFAPFPLYVRYLSLGSTATGNHVHRVGYLCAYIGTCTKALSNRIHYVNVSRQHVGMRPGSRGSTLFLDGE